MGLFLFFIMNTETLIAIPLVILVLFALYKTFGKADSDKIDSVNSGSRLHEPLERRKRKRTALTDMEGRDQRRAEDRDALWDAISESLNQENK